MNVFSFTFSKQKTDIDVTDSNKVKIGTIKRIELESCEKNHTFSFQPLNGDCVQIGIKKRSMKEMFAPKYIIVTSNNEYELQDNAWKNILFFSVSGTIDEQTIDIEENWRGELETKVEGKRIAIVSFGEISSKIKIRVAKQMNVSALLFAVVILFPFMFKIYEKETGFFENIIEELL